MLSQFKTIALIAGATTLTFGIASVGQAATINGFGDFSDWQLNGTAKAATGLTGQQVLRLTDNYSQSGSAFSKNKISLADNASFGSIFNFQFSNQKSGGADGIVFAIQTVSNVAGGYGGGIGYAGIKNSVGIEFDNWYNSEVGDPSDSHVGININGSVNSVAKKNIAPNLDNGDVWSAWVDYNGATKQLEVRLSQGSERPEEVYLSHAVDLATVLGSTDAFVGFTSGTGGAAANHDVFGFQFNNTFKPIEGNSQEVPEPITGLVVAAGMGGAALRRAKSKKS
jgi:Legume lectin domain